MRLIPIDDPGEPVIKSDAHITQTKHGIVTGYLPKDQDSLQVYELLKRHDGTKQWYRLDFEK